MCHQTDGHRLTLSSQRKYSWMKAQVVAYMHFSVSIYKSATPFYLNLREEQGISITFSISLLFFHSSLFLSFSLSLTYHFKNPFIFISKLYLFVGSCTNWGPRWNWTTQILILPCYIPLYIWIMSVLFFHFSTLKSPSALARFRFKRLGG